MIGHQMGIDLWVHGKKVRMHVRSKGREILEPPE